MVLVWLMPHASRSQEPPPVRLAVDLADGSHIEGTPSVSELPFRTDLGRFNLNVRKLRFLSMSNDGQTASVTMDNGDVLTATPEWDSLKLTTALGPITLEKKAIVRIAPASPTGSVQPTIDALIRELGDTRDEVRQRASLDLRRIGGPAVHALRKAAGSDDSRTAKAAEEILADKRLGIPTRCPEDLARQLQRYSGLDADKRSELTERAFKALKAEAVPFLLARFFLADPSEAKQILEHAIKALSLQLKEKDFTAVAAAAAELAKVAPLEARLLYLQAQALRQLGKKTEAEELEARALALNPGDKSSHFTAGDFLFDLGLDALSIRECESILKIDAAGDVYDINAWLRLGEIAARHNRYEEAANHYEKALTTFRNARAAGVNCGVLVGGTEDEVDALIKDLRRKAKAAANAPDKNQLNIRIKVMMKDGKEKEFKETMAGVRITVKIDVQPFGFRLLDLKECRLSYDKEKEELSIRLHDSPAGKSQRCPLGAEPVKICVQSLDCYYIYEVDPRSGEVKPLDRFELDYFVTVIPAENLRNYQGKPLKIGEKEYPWKDLLGGTAVDFLPKEMEFILEGPAGADGKPHSLKYTLPIDERAFEKEGK
jgi:tetratricopeptide (TPR) repeat protein